MTDLLGIRERGEEEDGGWSSVCQAVLLESEGWMEA